LEQGEHEYDQETIPDLMDIKGKLKPPRDFKNQAALMNISNRKFQGSNFLYLENKSETNQTEKETKLHAWFCGSGKLRNDYLYDGLLYSGEDELKYHMFSDQSDRNLSDDISNELKQSSDQPHVDKPITAMGSSNLESVSFKIKVENQSSLNNSRRNGQLLKDRKLFQPLATSSITHPTTSATQATLFTTPLLTSCSLSSSVPLVKIRYVTKNRYVTKKTPITPCGRPDPGRPISPLGAGRPQGVSS
jgi:hypothetical protein